MQLLHNRYLHFLFIAILYILTNGYLFNTGDQAEHLPQLYQKLNPELYPCDFFLTYYNQTFTVRFYFVNFMYALAQLFGVELSCFLVYIICVYWAVAGVYFLLNCFTDNTAHIWMGVYFYLFFARYFVIGGNYFQDDMLVGSSIAEVMCVWAFVLLFRNKIYYAALLAGIASLFQPLIGLHVAFIMGGALLIKQIKLKEWNVKTVWELLGFTAIYFAIAAFVLLPIALKQSDSTGNNEEANKILYEYRGALHYLPQLFPVKDYILMVGFLLAAIVVIYYSAIKNKQLLLMVIGFTITCTLLFAVYLLINPYSNLGKLQWFKTSVWLNLLAAVCVIGILQFKSITFGKPLLVAGIVCICCLSGYKGFKNYSQNKLPFCNTSELTLAHEWILNNTPVDCIVLAPPNDYSFSCEAKRSMPVNYKAIVHEAPYLLQWKAGMEKYYGVDFAHLEKLNCLPAAVNGFYKINFSNYGNKEIDYVMLAKQKIPAGFYDAKQICFSNKEYMVLKMK
ncbi:MAG: DUF6798 domain-containing protein [Bacteroidota bacterium]